ncbi:MAG: UDP-N-acetylmuramoyl-L-alanyl-D-glutamate--2,6-diaminopimelate ligase [Ignavibacteriales bacterium]|nr:UDP-N-acetylmuramoyl-L-alanyl-D-glutamate--2,6-diaminopimelate ligase [Ignavibacteriales bacterium]
MNLLKILNSIEVIQVTGNPELKEIANITSNSNDIIENSIFVAIKGFKNDGHKYIPQAIEKNVDAIILENENGLPEHLFLHSGCVKILVKNSRKALAAISNVFYNEPSKKIKLIGITGTKGKTTTSYITKNILETARLKTGLIGTIQNLIGEQIIKTSMTTPEANSINQLFAQMVEERCSHCVMEVSSHALDLFRVAFLDFDVAVFTNLTSDHLDYHINEENYLKAKKILFDNIKSDGFSIYNNDDKNAIKIISDTKAKRFSYGVRGNNNLIIKNFEYDLDGTRGEIIVSDKTYKFKTKLIGKFTVYNVAAAFSICYNLGIDIDTILDGIKTTPYVPGRFEVISNKNKKVIIDYSHTSDSLQQALQSIHHIVEDDRPIYTIFGCGGDRDRTKRPIMGSIAASMSKKVIVTSDNPRTEDPMEIIKDITRGINSDNYSVIENREEGINSDNYSVIENREEAIKDCIQNSEDNAVILIAGKGHEDYQEINGVRLHFSDKEIAYKYLN